MSEKSIDAVGCQSAVMGEAMSFQIIRCLFQGYLAYGYSGNHWFASACSYKVWGSMGRTLLLLALGVSLCLITLSDTAAGLLRPAVNFPLPLDSYGDQQTHFSANSWAGFSGSR